MLVDGTWLRIRRVERGWTQERLSKFLRVPAEEILRWESHQLSIPGQFVESLKKCFACRQQVGEQVESIENDYGPGRLQEITGNRAVVAYFTSPTAPPRVETLDARTLWPAPTLEQTRVYLRDPSARWRVGRLVEFGERTCHVRLPNSQSATVSAEQIHVRWRRPIDDPTEWLAASVTETPYWHVARAKFVRFAIEQRATFRGLTALASASISLHRHQFEVVRAVLRDPIQRYILADEVGLGKTIEAGLIIRQYLLDEPRRAQVLVVTPTHLVSQWRNELATRLNLRNDIDARVFVVSVNELETLPDTRQQVGMLVIDEAHQLARDAVQRQGSAFRHYRVVERLSERTPRVLLLSATPLLHNEDGFLAMLHLLDPAVYPLTDRARFRTLVARREKIAAAAQQLQDDAPETFLENALDDLQQLTNDERSVALAAAARELCVNDPEDPDRVAAIRSLRTHIVETHRIDRRVLRTRREDPAVAPDLPTRMTAERATRPCPVRCAAWQLVEDWRVRACYANGDGSMHGNNALAVLERFVQAALSHPLALRDEASQRGSELARGTSTAFPGEQAWLADYIAAIPANADGDPRIAQLVACVKENQKKQLRSVIFIDDPRAADAALRALESWLPGRIRRAPLPPEDDATCVAVVCGRDAEEGINLQQVRAALVHFDLPFAPGRIEQRIGRVDRIGARSTRILSHLLLSDEPWELAWADVLESGTGVFNRSIAPLQYVLEDQMRVCRGELLDEGPEALRRTIARMRDPETGLDRELDRIRAQELLDAFEVPDDDDDRFASLEAEDERTASDAAPVRAWVEDALQFYCRSEDGDRVQRFVYADRNAKRPTLLSAGDLVGPLRFGFERAAAPGAAPRTERFTRDRDYASKHRMPLLRIGHPLIDGLIELARYDDRGVAWAFWRVMPGRQRKPEVFFRFDFVVTLDDDAATAFVRSQGGSEHAVHRRSDEAFPPLFRTVWTDQDGDVVLRPTPELETPYQKTDAPWRDVNLNPNRWTRLEERRLIPGWERICEQTRASAEHHLRKETALEEICRERVVSLERKHAVTAQRLRSRLDRLREGTVADYERALLFREEQLFEAFRRGIRSPRIRPDSAGAIFLSGDDPFGPSASE
jgi:ATP-dependent helicase HepA